MTAVTAPGCPYHAALPKDGTPFAPSPEFAQWRAEAPATRLRAEDGNVGWFITGYDLARAVLEDPRFSATRQRYPLGTSLFEGEAPGHDALAAFAAGNVLSLDPPQHTRIRRSVTSRFSVRSVRGRLPEIRAYVARRLEDLAAGTTAELFADLAVPVSVFTHCEVLGIPEEHRARFVELFVDEVRPEPALAFVRELLELRRGDPGEDTITDLLASDLTAAEREGILTVLMASGRDAIAYMISTNAATLLRHPDQLATLRSDPARIPAAVEEFVRFNAMFLSTHPRTVAEDCDLDGIPFRAGESVWVSTVAANRDPERFEDPDAFDVSRDAYGHVAFGHGIHGCIGQQLARLVIGETIAQLLARFPHLRLVEAQQAEPMPFAGNLPTYAPGRVVVGW
jgi:cytochrome P450